MRLVLMLVALLSGVASAQAQERTVGESHGTDVGPQASRPSHLARVFVQRTDGGSELSGHLLRLGPDTLTLLVNGQRVELPLDGVQRIQTPSHSVKRGARLGGLIGGVWCALVCGQGVTGSGQWAAVVAVNTGFFAAIGAGIHAAIPGRSTIYEQTSPLPMRARPAHPALSLSFRF